MPTSQARHSNKGKPNSIKQASILFYPKQNPKPTTTNNNTTAGVYSQNVNRQRTFTSYYSSLEAPKKATAYSKSHYQNQVGVRPMPTSTCQPNFLTTLKYNSNSFEQFDSHSDFDEKSLINIKDNYNRSIASLGESLDLFNVTSSAANRILSSSNRGSLLNIAYCPKSVEEATTEQAVLILKVKHNRLDSAASERNKQLSQQRNSLTSSKSYGRRFAAK